MSDATSQVGVETPINVPDDLDFAQWLLDTGRVQLPAYLEGSRV